MPLRDRVAWLLARPRVALLLAALVISAVVVGYVVSDRLDLYEAELVGVPANVE